MIAGANFRRLQQENLDASTGTHDFYCGLWMFKVPLTLIAVILITKVLLLRFYLPLTSLLEGGGMEAPILCSSVCY